VRTKSPASWLCAVLCLTLAAAACGGGSSDEAAAEKRHAEILAALAEISQRDAEVARKLQSMTSKVEAMIARGVMVIPPGKTWEKRAAFRIPVLNSPTKGPDDAVVRVVEFADFECPYCRANAGLPDTLLKDFPGEVQFVFKHYPLSRKHPDAEAAARASIAAAKQGKFWEMHDRLFSTGRLSHEDLREHAQALGLDMKRFDAFSAAPRSALALTQDRTLARDLGVGSTPTFFVNGKKVDGGTYEAVAKAIRAELSVLDKQGERYERALEKPSEGPAGSTAEEQEAASPDEKDSGEGGAPAPATGANGAS
jgi:protein-disulfide isomerase